MSVTPPRSAKEIQIEREWQETHLLQQHKRSPSFKYRAGFGAAGVTLGLAVGYVCPPVGLFIAGVSILTAGADSKTEEVWRQKFQNDREENDARRAQGGDIIHENGH